jgi:hypothetical protein
MKSLLIALITLSYLAMAQEVAMNNIVQTSVVQTSIQQTKITDEIADLESRVSGISSILVKGTVNINNTIKGKGLTLNAVLFTTGDKTRIRIDFAGAPIIDYVLRDDLVTIYLPHKDVVFSGTRDETTKLKSWFSLLVSELSGFSMAFPEAWAEHATQRRFMREKNSMVIFNIQNDLVKILKKVTFTKASRDLIIGNVYKYDDNGDLSGVIMFDTYKTIDGKLLPHKVSFAVNEENTIQFGFTEVEFDQPASDTIFQIRIPTETRKFHVSELEKKDWLSN